MVDPLSGEPASETETGPTSPTAASPGPPGCAPLELLELHAPHAIDAAAHSAPSPRKVQIRRACMSCLSAGALPLESTTLPTSARSRSLVAFAETRQTEEHASVTTAANVARDF